MNHTKVKMIGLCNVPLNMIDSIKKRMGLEEAEVEYVGLNHLSYVTSIKYQGKDYLQDALSQGVNSEAMRNIPASGFTSEQIQAIGAIPSSYLEYYYFPAQKIQKLLNTPKTRGEVCIELEEVEDMDI